MQPLTHPLSNQSNPQKANMNSALTSQKSKPPVTANRNENVNNIEPEWWTKPKKKVVSLSNLLRALCQVKTDEGSTFSSADPTSQKLTKDMIRYPSSSKHKLKKVQNLQPVNKNRSPQIKILSTHQVSLLYPDSHKTRKQQQFLDPTEKISAFENNEKIANQSLLANANHEWNTLQWKNLSKLFPGSNIINTHEKTPNDIIQGRSRDSYLLSGLAALAEQPHIIHKFIQQSTENPSEYQVKLLKNGQWNTINIDDSVPVDNDLPAFSYSKNGSFWVPLIQKAWAKLQGSYESIQKGITQQILHNLTGAPIKHFFLHSQFFEKQKFWRYLNLAHEKNYIMIATANFGSEVFLPENLNLHENETFTILGIQTEDLYGHKERVIKLRNNWRNFKSRNIGDHSEVVQMNFGEFIRKFRLVVVAEMLNQGEYKSLSVKSEQYQGAYYKIEVDEEGDYTFIVNRNIAKEIRNSSKPIRYPEIMIELGRIDYKRVVRYDGLISRKRTATKTYKLTPGYYIAHVKILPSKQFPIKQDQQIALGVYSQGKYQLKNANQLEAMMLSQNQEMIIKYLNEKFPDKQNTEIMMQLGHDDKIKSQQLNQNELPEVINEKREDNLSNKEKIKQINEQIEGKDVGEQLFFSQYPQNNGQKLIADSKQQQNRPETLSTKINFQQKYQQQYEQNPEKQQTKQIVEQNNELINLKQQQAGLNQEKQQIKQNQNYKQQAQMPQLDEELVKKQKIKEHLCEQIQEEEKIVQYQQNLHHQFDLFQKHLFSIHIPTEIPILPLLFIEPQEDDQSIHSYEYQIQEDGSDVARSLFPPSEAPRSSRLYIKETLSRSASRQLLPIHSQQISMQGDFQSEFKKYSQVVSDNQRQPSQQPQSPDKSSQNGRILTEQISPEDKEFHTKVNYRVVKNETKNDSGQKNEEISLIVDKVEHPRQDFEEKYEFDCNPMQTGRINTQNQKNQAKISPQHQEEQQEEIIRNETPLNNMAENQNQKQNI